MMTGFTVYTVLRLGGFTDISPSYSGYIGYSGYQPHNLQPKTNNRNNRIQQ